MATIYVKTDTELPEVKEHEFYPTPLEFCRAALDELPHNVHRRVVLDPGAGTGVWGEALRETWSSGSKLVGVEIREDAKKNEVYDYWRTMDFMDFNPVSQLPSKLGGEIDLVIGNPPYSITRPILEKSLDLLQIGGRVVFLLKLSFLASKKRMTLWCNSETRPYQVIVCANRPSFTGNNKTGGDEFAFFYWQKGLFPNTTHLKWKYINVWKK